MTFRLKISWFTSVKVSKASEIHFKQLHGNVVRRSNGDLVQFTEIRISDEHLRNEPESSLVRSIYSLNSEICRLYEIEKKVAYLWADPDDEGTLKLNFQPKWLELLGHLGIALSVESSIR